MEKLKPALHYQAKSFASALLINQGKGEYEMKALPNEAQISSINDILIVDVNADDHLDLVVAGNLFTSEVETPRNDAGIGLLLLGDGENNFSPVSAQESGLVIPHDVKKMAVLPGKEKDLILFGINDGPMQFYLSNEKLETLEIRN